MSPIPKRFWCLWFQGENRAPYIVKQCLSSWRSKNPSWDIVVLDEDNIARYIDIDVQAMLRLGHSYALISDLVRLKVLLKYGGVWGDATTYCISPLDHWLIAHAKQGFFVFRDPGRDRLCSSWFIAASQGHFLIKEWLFLFQEVIASTRLAFKSYLPHYLLIKLLGRSARLSSFWVGLIKRGIFKIYPYYIVHYVFNYIYYHNVDVRECVERMSFFSANEPHYYLFKGLSSPAISSFEEHVESLASPLYKLSYKNMPEHIDGTVLDIVLRH